MWLDLIKVEACTEIYIVGMTDDYFVLHICIAIAIRAKDKCVDAGYIAIGML